ncbi:cytochrome P450 [Actinokineospora sp. PR83]|uniref:cytochrome P450 family protein n=1 Tax=Actinokineospora sp. PR83 TaxID=2884908 RepID=UPI0027E11A6F|nr:cytochrome P450 [Actinokineospora sp. PR83]MCG8915904.1 cytochrome P450 [Actinokineospora sp. PR83]
MTATAENPAGPVELLAPELTADPFAGYARMRERAPMLTGTIVDGGPPMWLVTRYDDVRRVLTDPRFLNNPAAGPSRNSSSIMKMLNIPSDLVDYLADKLMQIDGADHRRQRTLVSKVFTARRVAALRPQVEDITARLLDRMAEAGRDGATVDLMASFCYPVPITVICELVGIDEADRGKWGEWGRVLSAPTEYLDRVPTVLRECVDHVLDVIARRRAEPRDDLISALVQVQEDNGDRLSEREMVTLVFTLVITGYETTTYMLGNSVLALLEHPDQLALLREDPSRWPQAVTELMRLGPAQWGLPRYPTEEVEVGGVTIPAGSPVMPLLLAANTDPRRYDDPDRLDIGRDSGQTHLGFGQGTHYCLGAPLAIQEAEVALRALFTRFPDLSLAVAREQIPWVPRPGVTRVDEIPLKLA